MIEINPICLVNPDLQETTPNSNQKSLADFVKHSDTPDTSNSNFLRDKKKRSKLEIFDRGEIEGFDEKDLQMYKVDDEDN